MKIHTSTLVNLKLRNAYMTSLKDLPFKARFGKMFVQIDSIKIL